MVYLPTNKCCALLGAMPTKRRRNRLFRHVPLLVILIVHCVTATGLPPKDTSRNNSSTSWRSRGSGSAEEGEQQKQNNFVTKSKGEREKLTVSRRRTKRRRERRRLGKEN